MANTARNNALHIQTALSRFGRDQRGVSLFEFALTFPILIILFLGMVEFGEAFSINRRVTDAAATASDLVAQYPMITSADLADIALVTDELIKPYSTTPFGMVITSVVADEYNNTTVGWSYATGTGATARAVGSAVTLPTGLTEAGTSVIMVETSYQFSPTVGLFLLGTHDLEGIAYFRPRLTSVVVKTDG
ncbi:MAG: pilus assembly protein [Alphaproteobacteria bacterium]